MKVLLASCIALALAGCASRSDSEAAVPLEIVQGKVVQIWGASVMRTLDGVKVKGFAKRRLAPNGAVNEHLHADAFAETGELLESKAISWNTPASVRVKASTSFQTTFEAMPAGEPSRIRLRAAEGSKHADGEAS